MRDVKQWCYKVIGSSMNLRIQKFWNWELNRNKVLSAHVMCILLSDHLCHFSLPLFSLSSFHTHGSLETLPSLLSPHRVPDLLTCTSLSALGQRVQPEGGDMQSTVHFIELACRKTLGNGYIAETYTPKQNQYKEYHKMLVATLTFIFW